MTTEARPGLGALPPPHGTDPALLSRVIEVSRVALVVGLVFLHYGAFPNATQSPFRGFTPGEHAFATFVNSAMLFFFFSAVPLLSCVSGWLFFGFLGRERPWPAMRRRMRSRSLSLYAPLVAWNALFLAAALAIYATGEGGALLAELNIRFDAAHAMDYANAVLGLTEHPIAFQFWFVRDLFLTVLVSPLLWLMLRRAPLAGAVFLGLVWITDGDFWIFFRTDVLFFFYLGGLMRLKGWMPLPSRRATLWLLLAYVALVSLRALAPLAVDTESAEVRLWLDAATRAMRPVGVAASWGVCLAIAGASWGRLVARHGNFAFFLHATHFPLIAAVKLALWKLIPSETDGWMLAHYAASVVVTIALCLAAARLITAVSPGLYAFLAGGRDLRVEPGRAGGRLAPVPG
jgi:hypothetical protein